MFWRKFQLPFSIYTQCIRTAQRHSLVLVCFLSWLALSRLQLTSTALPWLTGATKSAPIRGSLKITGLTMVVNTSTVPLYFSPSNTQPCPELQPKTLPHLQLTRKLSSRALFPRPSLQLKLSLGSPLVPGIWGQRVTAATRCHLCTEAAGSVTVHGHGPTRATPLPLHFRHLRHKLREVFRTSFLQVTGFPPPEHHLCLQPSLAYFGMDTLLCRSSSDPTPLAGMCNPALILLPWQGGANPTSGMLLQHTQPREPALPGPGAAALGERKTLLFKAYFISTELFLDQYYHDATKQMRLREQVWAVLSDLAFRPTPVLFFQPCFRLLLTLMPSQPYSWSREPTWHRAMCKGI